jgi:hypothetical protein
MKVRIVIGCNYHTTWQKYAGMRFVLVSVNGTKARLKTRKSDADFETNISDLIFIDSDHNKRKADRIEAKNLVNNHIESID